MIRFVVRPHEVMQLVQISHSLVFSKIPPHPVFSVRLNLPTILALVSSLCVEKWRTPCSFSKASKDRLRNSSPLSVCSVIGLISDSNSINAITNDDADLFFSRMHHAHFENTSITVSKNVIPSLYFSVLIRRRNRPAIVSVVLPLRRIAA